MTKEKDISKMETLTEQWKNGELEEDFYYVKNKSYLGVEIDYYPVLHGGIKYWSGCDDEDIEEVLAPVPFYDQFVELTEKANQFSQLVKKVDELTTRCRQLEKKVKKRGMQINRAYDRYVAKRKENSELVQKIHILNEANMNLENTIGKFGEQLDIAVKALRGLKPRLESEDDWLIAARALNEIEEEK